MLRHMTYRCGEVDSDERLWRISYAEAKGKVRSAEHLNSSVLQKSGMRSLTFHF